MKKLTNFSFSKRKASQLAMLSLTLLTTTLNAQPRTDRKNVVLVMADDFNYWNQVVRYSADFLPQTPNIAKLATKGVLFSDAQASSPVCNPSRTAMFTGLRPTTTDIKGNSDGHFRDKADLQKVVALHQYFKDNGYYVYGTGKLLHNSAGGKGGSDAANFSKYSDSGVGCDGGDYLKFQSKRDGELNWSVNDQPFDASVCKDLAVAEEAAKEIADYSKSINKDKPFFIGCGVSKPHLGWNVPLEFYKKFESLKIDVTKLPGYRVGDLTDTGEYIKVNFEDVVDNNKWEESIKMYLSCLALADHNAGVVFDAIENSIYKDNTIVVFMGDHGWHLGEKERFGKASPWDIGNRTTLVIYDPSHKNTTNQPRVCKKLVSLQDIYPTLVELAGLPIKTNIEGNSIAALIEDPKKKIWNKPVLVSRDVDRLRTNRWSYSRNAEPIDVDYSIPNSIDEMDMLYDIAADPNEFSNLLDDKQTIMPREQVLLVKARLDRKIDSIIAIGKNIKKKLDDNYAFKSKVLRIPGTIEAEDYDEGVNQQTYLDSDPENKGGKYRLADGTDIYSTDDNTGVFHLADVSAGEWCNYTVSNFIEGKYSVSFRIRRKSVEPALIQIFNRDVLLAELTVSSSVNKWASIKSPEFALVNQNSTRLQIKVKSGSVDFNNMAFQAAVTETRIPATISRKALNNTTIENGVLELDLNTTDAITNISIYDISGKLLTSESVAGEGYIKYVPKSKLVPGVYLLQIKDELSSSIEKFIVK